jgi:hypothetical protein
MNTIWIEEKGPAPNLGAPRSLKEVELEESAAIMWFRA